MKNIGEVEEAMFGTKKAKALEKGLAPKERWKRALKKACERDEGKYEKSVHIIDKAFDR